MSKPNFIGLALDTTSKTINTKIDSISTNVTNLDSKISTVDTSISSISPQITELHTKVNNVDANISDNYIDSPTARYVWSINEDGTIGWEYAKEMPVTVSFYEGDNNDSPLWTDIEVLASDWKKYRSEWYVKSWDTKYPAPLNGGTVLDMVAGALYLYARAHTTNIDGILTDVRYASSVQSGYQIYRIVLTPKDDSGQKFYTTTVEPVRGMNIGKVWMIDIKTRNALLSTAYDMKTDLGNLPVTPGMQINARYVDINESNGEVGVSVKFVNDTTNEQLAPEDLVYSEEMRLARLSYKRTSTPITINGTNVMDAVVAAATRYMTAEGISSYNLIAGEGFPDSYGLVAKDTPSGYYLKRFAYKIGTNTVYAECKITSQSYGSDGQTSTVKSNVWQIQVGDTLYPANYALDHIGINDGDTIIAHYTEEMANAVREFIPTEPLALPPSTASSITVEFFHRKKQLYPPETVTIENAIAERSTWATTSISGYTDSDEPPTILDAVITAINQIGSNPDYVSMVYTRTQKHQTYIDPPINKGYAITKIERGVYGTSSYASYSNNTSLLNYTHVTGSAWLAVVNGYTISPVRYSLANIPLKPGMTIQFKFDSASEDVYRWIRE